MKGRFTKEKISGASVAATEHVHTRFKVLNIKISHLEQGQQACSVKVQMINTFGFSSCDSFLELIH